VVKKTRTLWMIGDGKPGHENQSLGLTDAIARITPCQVHRISLAEVCGRIAHIRSAVQTGLTLPPPDLILAAGHATHVPLVLLSRKFKAPSILLMRPSLPMQLFDLCVTPEHDFKTGYQRKKLLLTRGALNRVPPPGDANRSGKMILIGGPSKLHGWDGDALLTMLGKITASDSWQLTDSRRTPTGFTSGMRQRLPHLAIFPHEETGPHWLPGKLATAEEVWVTEDSVSMVYEALSSGAKVGLLPVPRRKSGSRVLKGIEKLIEGRFITRFVDWEKSRQLAAPPETLREADRCAAAIVERFGLAD
jgi:uncharacterized protein